MTKHTELIARLEALTGPDRKVDAEIGVILHIHPPGGGWLSHEYTGSIDAAVALCERVLPGWRYIICPIFAEVKHPEKMMLDRYGHGANPAIALLIATLKALDAKETAND